jgi:hypothetical protein
MSSPDRSPGTIKREETTMRKIIIAGFILAASTPALGDAVETIDPKSAVEFVLSTCLPAMDDLASVERLAQENKWFHLPTNPSSDSKYTTAHLRWRANGYFVTTWSFKGGNFPSCFIGIGPFKRVDRTGFFEAISAALELKPISNNMRSTLRQEMYEIVGERPLRLLFSSIDDGTMSGASIYMEPQNEQSH